MTPDSLRTLGWVIATAALFVLAFLTLSSAVDYTIECVRLRKIAR